MQSETKDNRVRLSRKGKKQQEKIHGCCVIKERPKKKLKKKVEEVETKKPVLFISKEENA